MATVGLSKEIYVIRDPAIHISGVSSSGQFWQCLQKDYRKLEFLSHLLVLENGFFSFFGAEANTNAKFCCECYA